MAASHESGFDLGQRYAYLLHMLAGLSLFFNKFDWPVSDFMTKLRYFHALLQENYKILNAHFFFSVWYVQLSSNLTVFGQL